MKKNNERFETKQPRLYDTLPKTLTARNWQDIRISSNE